MNGVCSTYEGNKKCMQHFGRNTSTEKTTWNILTRMRK